MANAAKGGSPVFEVRGLTKFYGAARGVEDITLDVPPGEIFGFLGPNGAGKTTVMRTALGMLRPTRGEVRLFGSPVHTASDRDHERLGYLPADLRLWPGTTARRLSDLWLSLGSPEGSRAWRDEIARRLEISLDRRVRSLSLGNRQKVGLMLALQHRPKLAILDEPTSGLDPLVRRTVMDILGEMAAEGTTIVYSSHNLPEVEQICSRVGILRKGRLVALEPLSAIQAMRERRLAFAFRPGSAAPADLPEALEREGFRRVPPVEHDPLAATHWEVRFHGSPDPLIRWLAEHEVSELHSPQVSLEETFMQFYREPDPANRA